MPAPQIRELPYFADSALYMRALSMLEMPAYLDSASHGGEHGTRDVLAAAPVAYVCVEKGEFTCSENAADLLGGSIDSRDFLSYIRLLKEVFLPFYEDSSEAPALLEHCGAVIGYLGYPELTGRSELRIHDAFVGVYLWTLVVDHVLNRCSLRFHGSCSTEFIEQAAKMLAAALKDSEAEAVGEFRLDSDFQAQSSYENYEDAFDDIKSRIDRGDCYQVNLTQCFKARSHGAPLEAYLRLRDATAAPFSAYMHWGSGALLSLSPERFLSLRQKSVLTQPVKGTRPRGASAAGDARLALELANSEKDKAENLMIVDLLRNDLGRICETGSIVVNQLFSTQSFSNVHHLVSDVCGQLQDGMDALDLLASCYPGGSITGAPKLSAMSIIKAVEKSPRRAYCGTAFCWSGDGSFDSNITIRSLLWKAGELSCWAGGGIVADSDCAAEYRECFDKIGNIFRALQA